MISKAGRLRWLGTRHLPFLSFPRRLTISQARSLKVIKLGCFGARKEGRWFAGKGAGVLPYIDDAEAQAYGLSQFRLIPRGGRRGMGVSGVETSRASRQVRHSYQWMARHRLSRLFIGASQAGGV